MLKKRLIIVLTFNDGVLFRTKKFIPDYRYTKNFVDLWKADEIILLDISKKKLSKKFIDIVNFFSKNCFLPVSVGGGINNLKNIDLLFKNGADKIVLNSSTFKNSKLIKKASDIYGSQAIIHSVDIKKTNKNKYTVMINNGKFDTNLSPFQWAKIAIDNGAGELLINNIDNDGSLSGFDIDIIKKLSKKFKSPMLALGGGGNWEHFLELFKKTDISACCTQNIYHFTNTSLSSLKKYLQGNKINIRT